MVGFLLGFPVVLALALYQRSETVAFIMVDYKANRLFQRLWEVVSIVRKLLLTTALLFVPDSSLERISIALLISVAFQVQQAHERPYNNLHKNRMAYCASAALSFTYFFTLLIEAGSLSKRKEMLCALLLLLLLFVILAATATIVNMKRLSKAVLEYRDHDRSSDVVLQVGDATRARNVGGACDEVAAFAARTNLVAELKAAKRATAVLELRLRSVNIYFNPSADSGTGSETGEAVLAEETEAAPACGGAATARIPTPEPLAVSGSEAVRAALPSRSSDPAPAAARLRRHVSTMGPAGSTSDPNPAGERARAASDTSNPQPAPQRTESAAWTKFGLPPLHTHERTDASTRTRGSSGADAAAAGAGAAGAGGTAPDQSTLEFNKKKSQLKSQ